VFPASRTRTFSLVLEALNPVAGDPAEHEPNWQPPLPTVFGGESEEEVPDWFSAGEERTTEKPELLKVLTKDLTFCSAQPSSLDTTMLKALASKGDAARRKVVQRMVKMLLL
jgi:hypothetical protein